MDSKKFVKDSLVVTFVGLLGKVLGWVRDSFLISFLGTGALSDAFNLSVKIPTAFRKAVSEGAINNVLLPKLRDLEKKGGDSRVYALIFNISAIFSAILLFFYFAERYFQFFFLSKIAPGFSSEQTAFYIRFVTVTGVTSLVYFWYSLFSSLLQFRGIFFWPSFAVAAMNFSLTLLLFLALLFGWCVEHSVYFYFFSTLCMLCVSLIPSLFYSLFSESFWSKFWFAISLLLFFISFIFLGRLGQYILVVIFYSAYFYFARVNNFFSEVSFQDLRSFFFLFFPVFLVAIFTQLNDIIAMTFGSLFPAGSMTLVMRSTKVLQLPISFIVPFFITLFSYLNKSDDINNKLFFKRASLVFVFFITLVFCAFCFLFTDFLINLTFLYRVSFQDIAVMIPLVRIYSLALPAILMVRLLQMFFFVEKSVLIPAFLAFLNSLLYFCFMKFFITFNFSLSSLVFPFLISSWFVFFVYLGFARFYELI